MAARLFLIALLVPLSAAESAAQQYVCLWSGSASISTSGTISPGSSVTGSVVLHGPIENLPLAEIPPPHLVLHRDGAVAIDDGAPLHPLTAIQVQADSSGDIVDAIIQLVEEGDATAMGRGLFAADVVCVASRDTSRPAIS